MVGRKENGRVIIRMIWLIIIMKSCKIYRKILLVEEVLIIKVWKLGNGLNLKKELGSINFNKKFLALNNL